MDISRAISGRTQLTAVFGDPVEHSLSPVMHNAAYAALGIDRVYVAFHVTPENLREAIRAIPSLGILGVNLTVPHKESAAQMMAHLSDESRALGAVNCVINREGTLHGDNSDARGLEMDLRELRVGIEGKSAVIVGAGGAAASAVIACIRLGAARITICNRTVVRATRLARRLAGYQKTQGVAADRCRVEAHSLEALVDSALVSAAALVINATPMGLKTGGFADLDYGATHPDCAFYDLLYGREPTPFLAPAIALSRCAWDGAGMLLNQGAIAFELFNGVAPPKDVMRRTLMTALGRL